MGTSGAAAAAAATAAAAPRVPTEAELRLKYGLSGRRARQFVTAARRSDAFNEDDYDFAVVVRVALDAAQQRALEEAKRRADAIALASVTEVGGAAVPGLRRAYGSSGAIARIASPDSVPANTGRVVRIAEDEEDVRSPPEAIRAIRFDGATTVDESFSESDSASQSDSDALSDSEDDFFGSSDSDFDVRDAGAHGTKYGPPERALSPAVPQDAADIQVAVAPRAGEAAAGVHRHTGRRRLRSSLGLDVSGGARHKCQEVLEALRRAGLKAKRVRSLNRRKWLIKPLDRIAAYFGETVAFYFAWLEFYTQWLVFPALVGAALFVAQVWYGTVDVTWVPLFSLFMALWSTLFLEFWKRRNAELSHRWGVLNYEHEEVTRPQFRGTWRRDAVTGEVFRVYRTWRRLTKYLVTVPVVMACTGAVVVFMILLFTTRDAILVGIEAAACDRGDVAPDSAMCQRGASAGSLWQPAVDWGILSPTATAQPKANPDGLNNTVSNRILATAGAAQAGSTVTAVLGAELGTAAVGWAIRTSASAIVGSASTGRAVFAAVGLASIPDPIPPARRVLGANGTDSDEDSGGLLGIGSLSALGVESFEEWISRSGDMEWWLAMLLPPVAYGFLIPIFDFAFGRLAFRFTDWENHKTESLFRNHRIAKVFVFRFVNSFISLFYYAFSPSSSLLQLTVQLASFLLAGQLWNTILEVVFPCAWRWYKVCRFRQRVQRAVDSGLTEGRRGRRLLRHARSEAWAESRLAEYDTFNDYAEMLIQFGYVTFFSWAFPLAPLCALVNNVVEMRTDAYKLLYNTQRPIAYKAGGIGVWLGVLQGMSLLAVLTNCAHLALASKQFSLYFPGLTDAQKMLVVFLLEHAVLGVKLFLGSVIPHTPERVQKRVARDNFFLARLQGRRSVT